MAAPNWSWSFGPWKTGASAKPALAAITGPSVSLREATARSLRMRLLEPSQATFTLPGASLAAGLLEELISDVWVYRGGVALFRGRVMSTRDTVGVTHETVVQAGDYRQVLDRRIRWTDRTWTGVDQSTIAWDAVTDAQSEAGGDIGITRGTWPASTLLRPSVTAAAGDTVWGFLKRLGQMDGGFDFDVDENLHANLYWPHRGADVGTLLAYGGVVASVDRVFQPDHYANAVRQSGADGVAVATVTTSDIGTAPEGRWDAQFGDTQLLTADMVAKTAATNLQTSALALPVYSLTLTEGRWDGPSHVWLGDYVDVVVRSGRLNERVTARVYEMNIDVDANNQETVTVVAGDIRIDPRSALRGIARRVIALAIR